VRGHGKNTWVVKYGQGNDSPNIMLTNTIHAVPFDHALFNKIARSSSPCLVHPLGDELRVLLSTVASCKHAAHAAHGCLIPLVQSALPGTICTTCSAINPAHEHTTRSCAYLKVAAGTQMHALASPPSTKRPHSARRQQRVTLPAHCEYERGKLRLS
jgi:hypothetical protein